MDANRWKKVQEIFTAALRHPAGDRASFIRNSASGDDALYDEVVSLLDADEHSHSLLKGTAADALGLPPARSAIGQIVGSYRIVAQVGAGGMGTVYAAERADGQFVQKVAIKLIRHGMDSGEILNAFRHERQILAHLNHPHIARLLDGGVTDTGLPFFAMEFVDGEPIDRYCDRMHLTIDARLRLFRTVCDAVHYAHTNLVVHRDLKPGNIMVTADGRVKLLDFGIARVLSSGDDPMETSGLTRAGYRVMTPAYASPEQVKGNPVTTASDVYALGIVLYELLTGNRPYDVASLSPAQVESVVCTTTPKKPSAFLSRREVPSPATLGDLSAARGTDPDRLRRRLAGDLDNICLMAIRKEPERRYASVEQFARDIERHLLAQPVTARPLTTRYRADRFVRRHRVGVSLAAAVLLLVGGMVGYYTNRLADERNRALIEAEKARQVAGFLTGVFTIADPEESKGRTVTAHELLTAGAQRVDAGLARQPEIQATMMSVIGNVYVNLGLYGEATPLLERSLTVSRSLHAGDDPVVAQRLDDLGVLLRMKGDYARSETLLRESLVMSRRLHGADTSVALVAKHLANVLHKNRNYKDAEPLYRDALAMFRERLGNENADVASTLTEYGSLLKEKGDFDGAERMLRESVSLHRRLFGENNPETSAGMNNLARVLQVKGDLDGADSLLRASLAIDRAVYGPEHPYVAIGLSNLGMVLKDKRDYDGAEALLRQALAINRKVHGINHPDVASTMNNLARVLYHQHNYVEAERIHREALQIKEHLWGKEHPGIATSLNNLAKVLDAEGKHDEAELMYRRALAMQRKLLGPSHPDLPPILSNVAMVLRDRGKLGESEAMLREALSINTSLFGSEHKLVALVMARLAGVLDEERNAAAAGECYRKALDIRRKVLPQNDPDLAQSVVDLGTFLLAQRDVEAAIPLLREGMKLYRASGPAWKSARVEGMLGECLTGRKQFTDAEPLLKESLATLTEARGGQDHETRRARARLDALYKAWGRADGAGELARR